MQVETELLPCDRDQSASATRHVTANRAEMASAAAAAAAAAAFIGHQHGQQRHQSQQAALPDAVSAVRLRSARPRRQAFAFSRSGGVSPVVAAVSGSLGELLCAD